MKNARCFGCGLVMLGRWRKGPPEKCPRCGFWKSKELLIKMAQVKKVEDKEKSK